MKNDFVKVRRSKRIHLRRDACGSKKIGPAAPGAIDFPEKSPANLFEASHRYPKVTI